MQANIYMYCFTLNDMAKHYLIAVEDKDEKLFRLFCEKNSKYAMVIGKETTNDRLGLDHLVYILNSISNQVGKSIGIKEWDYLRNYLKKKEKQYCPDSGNYREFKYQSDKQFDDNLAFPMNKRVYRR